MPVRKDSLAGERLQKVMAHAGVASRRACEQYIVAGRVSINGQVVKELGTRVHPQQDRISVDGKPLRLEKKLAYYAVYKPRGYVSTANDPQGRPTVVSLAPDKTRFYPVGRLDLDSEGLVLLTNDGKLTQRLTHPRYEHEKEYFALIKGKVTSDKLEALGRGIALPESTGLARGLFKRLPQQWQWREEKTPHDMRWMHITLREGKKRQIRRMMEAVRLHVVRIIRVRMGTLWLGELEPGQGRWLDDKEISALQRSAGLDQRKDAR